MLAPRAHGRVALVATGTLADTSHGRVALVATETPADTAHGRVALVATGKGYGRDKRGPPKRGPPKHAPSRTRSPARGRIFGIICKILDHNRNTFTMPREAKS